MSHIVMCDGCGVVTMEPASRVHVTPLVNISGLPTASRAGYNGQTDSYAKDFCLKCTEAILSPKKMQVLEMQKDGDL